MRKIILMLVVVATIINLVYWLDRRDDDISTVDEAGAGGERSATVSAPIPARTVKLKGVPIQISATGELIVDTRIKQLFDLLASQNTEEPVDGWKHQILQQFSTKLPPTALAQLQDAFDRYVEFNLALQLLPMEGAPNLQAVLQRVQTLREHYLGEYATPMFDDWKALEDFTQQYLTLMTQNRDDNATLAQLEALAAALPEPVQQRARNMIRHSAEDFAVDDMAALEPEAYTRMLQEQAAVTLIETTLLFDEPSPEFMAQYELYSEKKRDVLLSELSAQEQQEKLAALRREYFSGSEILRVETLDRAEAF